MTRLRPYFRQPADHLISAAAGMIVSLLLCLGTASLIAFRLHTVRDFVLGGLLAAGFLTAFGAFLTLYLSSLQSHSLRAIVLSLRRIELHLNAELASKELATLRHAIDETLHRTAPPAPFHPLTWELPEPTIEHSDPVTPTVQSTRAVGARDTLT